MAAQLLPEMITPQTASDVSVEVSIRGKWLSAPALYVGGDTVVVRGKLLKIAHLHNEIWLPTEPSDPASIIGCLKDRASSFRADLFTFAQIPPNTDPRYGYYYELESMAAVATNSFDQWWNGLPHEGRKNVRRAEKRGVVVLVKELDDDLIRAIMALNNESAIRQNTRFPHYGKSFDQVKKDQSTYLERSDFVCAYCQDELIGFMKLVYRGKSAGILQFISKMSHYDKRPANSLLAKAVELCQAKCIEYLIYGMMDYGNKRHSSLRDFKIRNGFTEMMVPRYYIPLTIRGRTCMAAKLHRGLLGILPPRVISLAVDARTQWYKLTQKPV